MDLSQLNSELAQLDMAVVPPGTGDPIRKKLSDLAALIGGAPVLFYGAGRSTHDLLEKYDFDGFDLRGFIDVDRDKQGRQLFGQKIFPPGHLDGTPIRHIVIATIVSRHEIRRSLETRYPGRFEIHEIFSGGAMPSEKLHQKIWRLQSRPADPAAFQELLGLHLYLRNFGGVLSLLNGPSGGALSKNKKYQDLCGALTNYPASIKATFERPASKQPSICLITLDTARAANCGLYGYHRDTTPFLSEMAGQSIVFRRAFSASNWTIPSHASIFTGKLPFAHGACTRFSRLKNEPSLLTHRLKAMGYQTLGFTNIPFLHPRYGFSSGFDHYRAFDRCNFCSRSFWEALQNTSRRSPFFLFLNFVEAHDPYESPEHVWGDPEIAGDKMRSLYQEGGRDLDPALVQKTMDLYDDGLRFMDKTLGYYYRAFPDNTVFIITSDHGELFGEKKMYGHMNVALHENVLRVPLLIFGAGIQPKIVEEPFSLKDLYALILAMGEGRFSGFPDLPAGTLAISERRRETQSLHLDLQEFGHDVRCITDGRYKLVEYSDGRSVFYVLPDEEHDVSSRPELAHEIRRLRSALHAQAGDRIDVAVNPLSEDDYSSEEKKKIEKRLESLGYL